MIFRNLVNFETYVCMNNSQMTPIGSNSRNVHALNVLYFSTTERTVLMRIDIRPRHTVRLKTRSSFGNDTRKKCGVSQSSWQTLKRLLRFSSSARTFGD